MNFNDYQQAAMRTANLDTDAVLKRLTDNPKLLRLLNYATGAAGEGGEIVDYMKKVVFHGHELDEGKLINEFGDQLWYASEGLRVLGCPLEQAAVHNIEKLKRRYPDGFSTERSVTRDD